MRSFNESVLVHSGAGVGNVVLTTPLLIALHEMNFVVDVWLAADYPQTIDLLRPWEIVRDVFSNTTTVPSFNGYGHILPAIPPFYWPHFAQRFAGKPQLMARPPQSLFYEDEQEFYMGFARTLGFPPARKPDCTLPISQNDSFGVTLRTIVLAPGCKTGLMATKRWPHFPKLAEAFDDVALVGTADDLRRRDGSSVDFPSHVRSFVDRLSLRQTAELMAGAGVVVANDSGLAHIAAAVGTPTIIIFGPTPHRTLGPFPQNVTVLRRGLPCEPCWFQSRFQACRERITCLEELSVEEVIEELGQKGFGRP